MQRNTGIMGTIFGGALAFLVSSASPAPAGPPARFAGPCYGAPAVCLPRFGCAYPSFGYGYPGYFVNPYPVYYGVGIGYDGFGAPPVTNITNNTTNNYILPQAPAAAAPALPMLPAPTPVTGTNANVATIVINAPHGADVWVQGVKLAETGPSRRYVSPPLDPGQDYRYDVRVSWWRDGREVSTSQALYVRAGDHKSVTFLGGGR